MTDATNAQKENLVFETKKEDKRESKRLSVRQLPQEDTKDIGPSSKSI
jgi:hypothetical protein